MALTRVTSKVIQDGTISTADLSTASKSSISGSFRGELSSSVHLRQVATTVSGSSTAISSSLASRVTVNEGRVNQGVKTTDSPTFADATITGTLTAQEIHTEFTSASILFTSGSTKIGNSGDDIHQMTGSVKISGSFRAETSQIQFYDDNTEIAVLENSSENLKIESKVQDKDIIFSGNDGGAGIEAMRIDMSEGGKVGIGTTSPDSILHIKGGANWRPILKIENTSTGNESGIIQFHKVASDSSEADNDYLGGIDFYGINDNNDSHRFAYMYGISTDVSDGTEDGRIDFMTAKAGTDTVTMTLSSGNVGIGTGSPKEKLDVSGDIANYRLYSRTGIVNGALSFNSYYNGSAWVHDDNSKVSMNMYMSDSRDNLEFAVRDGGASDGFGSTHLAIGGDGKIGIGTESPSSGLHLSGADNTASKFTITNTANSNEWSIHPNYNTGDLIFADGGTEEFRMLGGGGLTFNGDTAAANALDDYEEGTYTITITGSSGGSWTMRSGYTKASYTKIGRLVTITARYETSSKTGESGVLTFNLPFTVADLSDQAGGSVGSITLNRSAYSITDQISPVTFDNVAYFQVQRHENGQSETYMQASDIDGTFEGHFTLTYVAA